MDTLAHIHDVPVLVGDPAGPVARTEADALDLVVAAGHYGANADWLLLPECRLSDDFFNLSTGFAGTVAQKFVTYGIGLAILGDISARAVGPVADWARESNKGRHLWFVADQAEFTALLAKRAK
ncbi:hypothetical protein JOF56_004763 [Kibdelosporangium banguiense]|uniref:DUF4180 domain-containing protein n=1 Tax=Kibdelosporangium banguiense TaxID=1365924 RepID=A0ABS4TIX2_9PSEU|nr:DUF4180 domain-containing protein [Kibdelosporangium banguiense]MBP2324378.1 hypothetical protein [Kibdelosporangium banguiense]